MQHLTYSSPAPLVRVDAEGHLGTRGRKVAIPALTGIRAVAAAWVVLGHFRPPITQLFPFMRSFDPLFFAASNGVDLFFALSGFILTHNYLQQFQRVRGASYARFMGLRLARMYPVHLFTLLTLLAGLLLTQYASIRVNMPERLGQADFWRNVFLLQAWTPTFSPSWNGPAWSISAEWFAYLLFPFLSLIVARVTSPRAALLAAGTSLALLLIGVGFGIQHPLLRVTVEFFAGCMLYRVYLSGWGEALPWSTLSAAVVGATVGLLYVLHYAGANVSQCWAAPLMALLVLCLARSRTGISAFLTTRPMIFLGEVSYSLYMVHDLVRMSLPKLLPAGRFVDHSAITRAGVLGAYGITVFAAAVLCYWTIEQPGREQVRRLVERLIPKTPRPAPSAMPIVA